MLDMQALVGKIKLNNLFNLELAMTNEKSSDNQIESTEELTPESFEKMLAAHEWSLYEKQVMQLKTSRKVELIGCVLHELVTKHGLGEVLHQLSNIVEEQHYL